MHLVPMESCITKSNIHHIQVKDLSWQSMLSKLMMLRACAMEQYIKFSERQHAISW